MALTVARKTIDPMADDPISLDLSASSIDDNAPGTGWQRLRVALTRAMRGGVASEVDWQEQCRDAIDGDDHDAIERLLRRHTTFTRTHALELAALAVRRNNLYALDLFIKMGLPLNQLDQSRPNHRARSLLHSAARANWYQGVDALLSAGAAPDRADPKGYTPLHYAVRKNHMAIVRRLLLAKADPNGANTAPTRALQDAGSLEMLDELLRGGADPSLTDSQQRTALHSQVRAGRVGCVHALFRTKRVKIDAVDQMGRSALFYIGSDGNPQRMFDVLLGEAPDMALKDRDGNLFLHIWARRVNDERLFQTILNHSPRLFLTSNNRRETPLEILEGRGFTELAQRIRSLRRRGEESTNVSIFS